MQPETMAEFELPATWHQTQSARDARLTGFWRAVFSFPVVLGALLIVLMALTVRSRFSDPDLWWHLKTGEIIWNTHSIPGVDLFSFTAAGHAWIAQEWLSEVSIYGAWKLGGNTGLMLWLCVLSSLLAVGAYLLSTLYSENSKVAFLGGIITWLFSTVGLAIRPHMIGCLLLLCELIVLHLGRSRDRRWFLALPPLFAIWINCHSSFIFGLVVFAVVLACSFIDFRLGLLGSARWPKCESKMLAIAFTLSILALFANPIGPKLLWYPFDTMLNQPLNVHTISEWQQPSFETIRGLALLAVAALILLVPLLRRCKLALHELILVALGFGFAVRHERMVFIFGILAAPILCRLLSSAWGRYDPARDRILPNAVAIALLVPVIALAFPDSRSLRQQIEKANPAKAVAYLRNSGLSGPILNEYAYGGYLVWAFPEQKVFIDGRADLYEPAGVLGEYEKWTLLQTDSKAFLAKYRINVCLLSPNDPMVRVLPLLGWKTFYSDDLAVVLGKQP
jgi:hypothetical protein